MALLAAKFCCGRQVNKRHPAANDVTLLSTDGNVLLKRYARHWGGEINWLAIRMRSGSVVWVPLL